MTLVRALVPVEYPITPEDVKANSRIDSNDEDLLINGLIAAAVARAEMETGRAFAPQSWDLVLSAFPDGDIEIPLGPISDHVEITYADEGGGEQTISPDDFYVDTASADGRIVPVDSWPVAADRPNSVRVHFEVGATCPNDVKQALLLMVGHWYAQRETASDKPMQEVPLASTGLLALHRRMFV
jgi:uncharacterized phiE125 gp8 family phage protein